MLENTQKPAVRAGIVCPITSDVKHHLSEQDRLKEAVGLAEAVHLEVKYAQSVFLRQIKPASFFSRGYLQSLKQELVALAVELLIVDSSLTPIQQRNLENELSLKVIDRTALILEIFGERAQTNEGKLQVALAHLAYQRSRLVRSWTHLERQRGGAGFLGGPGEKQIELDRRLIDEKIIKIKKELEKVENTRGLQRNKRKRAKIPLISLVGYTNAGKSTLFNLLSGAETLAQDMLFATLDSLSRQISLPSGKKVLLTDTVGFISDLPHELIMAFRSTLDEVLESDLILHVRDAATEESNRQREDVLSVLHQLGLQRVEYSDQYIEVLNKTDLLQDSEKKSLSQTLAKHPETLISMSALTGKGLENLYQLVDQKLSGQEITGEVCVESADGRIQAWLYQNAQILNRCDVKDKTIFNIKISALNAKRLSKTFNINLAADKDC